jgi:hypothetical protein
MDDIVRRAIMEYDTDKREFECCQYQRQRQQQEQQEREQRQEQHRREQRNVRIWLMQSAGGEVRTTDFYAERNDAGNTGTGNDSAWNAWARDIASRECEALAQVIGNEVSKLMSKQGDDISARLDDLEQCLLDLEARVADLEGSGTNNKLAPVIPLRGGQSAA